MGEKGKSLSLQEKFFLFSLTKIAVRNILIGARNAEVCRTLAGYISGGYEVSTASDGMTIRSIDLSRFDYIFISSPLENENGLELLTELRARTAAHLIAIVREEASEAAAKRLSQVGAFVITKPVYKSSLMQAIRFFDTHAENEPRLRARIAELEQQSGQQKVISRAVLTVMTKENLSESEAYRRLQKLSMDLNVPLYEVAADILDGLLI